MTKITIEKLAGMIKTGFDAVDQRFDAVDKRFDEVGKRFDIVEKAIVTLAQGQEDIKLRLSNVAYRFELQELEQRVKKLETKLSHR